MMLKHINISRKKQEKYLFSFNYNWYRTAKVSTDKKPYMLVEIIRGMEKPIERLKNKTVEATSPAQAIFLFKKIYPWINSYLADKREVFGDVFDIAARVDEKKVTHRQNLLKMEKEKEEEQIQNAWWNK